MNLLWDFVSLVKWSAFVAILLFVLYLYFTRITNYWEVPGVEYLKSHFLFGDFYNVLVNRENFVLKMKDLYNAINGPLGGFYLFAKPVILIRDPDLIARILITDNDKFTNRGLLTSNLLLFKGDQWRPITDKLPTSMLKDIQDREFDVIQKTSITLQYHLVRVIKTSAIMDIRDLMVRFATVAMTSMVFSIEIDSLNTPDEMFCRMARLIATPTRIGQLRSVLAFTIPDFLKLFHIRTVDPDIEKFLHNTITLALELRETGKFVGRDYLQLLVQLRNSGKFNDRGKWDIKSVDENSKQLTIDEVVMQAFLFYSYELDAVSSAMSFALFEIARNREILLALQREIDGVLSMSTHEGRSWSSIVLNRMTYVSSVVYETLRKYPSVPIVMRSPLTPYKIPNTEIILDRNQEIFIPIYAVHHDPKYYDQPNEFDPHRFDPSKIKARENGTYFPLGDASPDWIRSDFTFLHVKMAIVAICSKFDLELAPDCTRDIKFSNTGTLNVEGNLNLRITGRKEGLCRSM